MIKYRSGSIFQSNADCLVNPVNCEGVMGKGLALQFKRRFPEMNKSYIEACKAGILMPGTIHIFVENGVTVLNFPTKYKWRQNSQLKYVETGLEDLINKLPDLGVKSIAIPALGCGLGGLKWEIVRGVIAEKLSNMDNYLFLLYEPG